MPKLWNTNTMKLVVGIAKEGNQYQVIDFSELPRELRATWKNIHTGGVYKIVNPKQNKQFAKYLQNNHYHVVPYLIYFE